MTHVIKHALFVNRAAACGVETVMMKSSLRWLVASIVYVVLFGVVPIMLLPLAPTPGVALVAETPAPWELPAYCALMLPAFVYLVHRPRVRGLAQLGGVAVFVWGAQTLMTQTETAYFWSAFPAISDTEMVRLFLRNLLTVATFLPIALGLAGRFRREKQAPSPGEPAHRGLAWKLPVLGVVYAVVYFVFGYFVAYQFEAVRVLYSSSAELPSFAAQLAAAVAERPAILPFQFVRGMMWAALSVPLLAILGRSRREEMLACAWLFAVLPTAQLLFTNPFMPTAVRVAHFLEVGSSMALFGAVTAWLLSRGGEREPASQAVAPLDLPRPVRDACRASAR